MVKQKELICQTQASQHAEGAELSVGLLEAQHPRRLQLVWM